MMERFRGFLPALLAGPLLVLYLLGVGVAWVVESGRRRKRAAAAG